MGKLFGALFERLVGNPRSTLEGVLVSTGAVLTTTGEPISGAVGLGFLGVIALKRLLDKDKKEPKEKVKQDESED